MQLQAALPLVMWLGVFIAASLLIEPLHSNGCQFHVKILKLYIYLYYSEG
jgi:hypothetical protein